MKTIAIALALAAMTTSASAAGRGTVGSMSSMDFGSTRMPGINVAQDTAAKWTCVFEFGKRVCKKNR